jgi:hypothetical protein
MEVVPDPLLRFDQPHFPLIMGNRTGQPHGVRQTVKMVDLDAGTVEHPQSEPNCQNANRLNPSAFSDSDCEDVWELTG